MIIRITLKWFNLWTKREINSIYHKHTPCVYFLKNSLHLVITGFLTDSSRHRQLYSHVGHDLVEPAILGRVVTGFVGSLYTARHVFYEHLARVCINISPLI